MKKIFGIILSSVSALIFFGLLIFLAGYKVVLISLGLTIMIVLVTNLCINLLSED